MDLTVDVTADDALGRDDVTALLVRLARGDVSAEELREAATARAHRANEQLNAVVCWVDDRPGPALTGDEPFAGIPTFVKDNEELEGYPTCEGSWAVPGRPAAASSPWVAQYLSLGVVPLAKTTLPEFGLTASTESTRYGATRNPWNIQRSVGGSSGGSAAMVAAGVVPMAHANDGGGSIRIPASCAGLVGLKPSRGRTIDQDVYDRLPVNLTHQGVVTRTVRDTALYYATAERAHRNTALPEIGHVTGPDSKRLRVGLLLTSIRGLPVDPEVVHAAESAGGLLERLGHHVDIIEAPVDDRFGPDFLRYWAFLSFMLKTRGAAVFGPEFDGRRTEKLTRGLAKLFTTEVERLPTSLRRLRKLARDGSFGGSNLDVMVSPVLGHEPPRLGYLGPDVDFELHLRRLLPYTAFTPVQNVSGEPAISLPLGRSSSGLPIGVQFAAPVGHERRLLALAYELEAAAPWPTRVVASSTNP